MHSHSKLKELLQENKGYLKTADAVSAGISRTVLGDFVRKYELERVAHGLYMSKDAWEDGMFVVQFRYPEAVFSHETALYLLNFANREPSSYSITLKEGTSTAGLTKQGIKVYKVKKELFSDGIVDVNTPSGHDVRAYNIERTICDLLRSRRNIETQELLDAIKDYSRYDKKNIPLLMRYAKAFSVEKLVRQYMEVLL